MLSPGHEGWELREALRIRIKEVLNTKRSRPSTDILWGLFTDAHADANRVRLRAGDGHINRELLDDLVWAEALFWKRHNDLDEMQAARRLWEWHYRADPNLSLRWFGEALEAVYLSNPVLAELERLRSRDDSAQKDPRCAHKARELAVQSPQAIVNFLDRTRRFAGDWADRHRYSWLGDI